MIPESRISVKATTTERLGFVGRGEGMAATAVCLLFELPPEELPAEAVAETPAPEAVPAEPEREAGPAPETPAGTPDATRIVTDSGWTRLTFDD